MVNEKCEEIKDPSDGVPVPVEGDQEVMAVRMGARWRVAFVALWLALPLAACGDAPSGGDRCGGKCKGREQCAPTRIEVTGPACYPSSSCQMWGYICVDPAGVHNPSGAPPDEEPQQ